MVYEKSTTSCGLVRQGAQVVEQRIQDAVADVNGALLSCRLGKSGFEPSSGYNWYNSHPKKPQRW